MKLTEKDKIILRELGHLDEDFAQIERAMDKRITKYEIDSRVVTREDVLELLGRRDYLSGLSRSAFHCTSSKVKDNHYISFDSSKLFKN